jgi:integrase/recombinase XerC
LLAAFLAGRNPRTLQAYRQDLEDFRAFVQAADMDEAARLLLAQGHGPANELALGYKAALRARGLAPATVNRRLAALRSLVKLARTLGFVPWTLEVESSKAQAYRDTRGPGREGFLRLLEAAEGTHAKAARDRALLRLLYDRALRRAEALALDVEDVDLEAGTVSVLGKGREQRELLSLPPPTRAALGDWLQVRPDVTVEEAGTPRRPLFVNFDHGGRPGRLSGTSLYRLVRDLGRKVGLTVRPHGLRHAAITEALELTSGNVRAVRRFSRHAKLDTLNVYDDNRTDLGGDVACLVAEGK